MRWRLRLAEYVFEIKHKKGILNTQADVLPRHELTGHTTIDEDCEIPCYILETQAAIPDTSLVEQISHLELVEAQASDDFCRRVREDLDNGIPVNFTENEHNGRLEGITPTGEHRVVVPQVMVPRILALSHRPVSEGHQGGRKMYTTMCQIYCWPNMSLDIYRYVAECKECAEKRIQLQKSSTPLQQFPAKGRWRTSLWISSDH